MYNSNVNTINYRCIKCGKIKHEVTPAPHSDGGYTIRKPHNKTVRTVNFSDLDGNFKVKKWDKKKKR